MKALGTLPCKGYPLLQVLTFFYVQVWVLLGDTTRYHLCEGCLFRGARFQREMSNA